MDITPTAIGRASLGDQAATCVELCKRWLQKCPDDITVIHEYASILYKMARYDEAIRIYSDAMVRFDDERWAFHNQLGHLFAYRGDLREAERSYQYAIDEDPEADRSYILVAEVRARQGARRSLPPFSGDWASCQAGMATARRGAWHCGPAGDERRTGLRV